MFFFFTFHSVVTLLSDCLVRLMIFIVAETRMCTYVYNMFETCAVTALSVCAQSSIAYLLHMQRQLRKEAVYLHWSTFERLWTASLSKKAHCIFINYHTHGERKNKPAAIHKSLRHHQKQTQNKMYADNQPWSSWKPQTDSAVVQWLF